MTSRRIPTAVAAALVAALAMAACQAGGGASTATPAGGNPSTAATAATDGRIEGGFPSASDELSTRSSGRVVFPGAAWQHADPAKLGFDPKAMRRLARAAKPSGTTCLLVARKGKVVGEWNWGGVAADAPREVWSVTKSVTSTLVGAAQADGDLDIDQKAKRYIEEWRGTRSRTVTIRDLLSNDSGRHWDAGTDYGDMPQAQDRTQFAIDLKQQYPPGKVWAYNNAAVQTLDRVITKATGQPTRDYAASRLFGPIGMTHTQMTTDAAGNTNTFFGMQTTCEDLARFGYLFLRHGRWGHHHVVPRSWVRAAVGRPSQDHNAAYGFLWWLNRRGPIIGPLNTDAPGQPEPPVGQSMPGLPANAYTAQGLGGQVMLVDPSSETIVVRIGQFQASPEDQYGARDAARFVTEALVRP
jgi:CubicO group peptidase (beta-lactamase class C family)